MPAPYRQDCWLPEGRREDLQLPVGRREDFLIPVPGPGENSYRDDPPAFSTISWQLMGSETLWKTGWTRASARSSQASCHLRLLPSPLATAEPGWTSAASATSRPAVSGGALDF